MLSTEELKKYVYGEISARLGKDSCSSLFFAEGTDNSAEGTYIFNRNNEYHVLFTEKGKVRSDIVTDDIREVLWNAVSDISADIVIKYASCNKEKGRDFRRALYAKEKEIYSLFGEDFKKKKEMEIKEILKKYPYNDV
ncbi:MAG: Imm63 family immunity protein [Ruminococcus flavefaciens]|nr:Imm63 family immunity protein [Ruminococcus flavefaciens]